LPNSDLPIVSSFPCAYCKKECLSELIGTYVLVVAGPSSVILVSLLLPQGFGIGSLFLVALVFGGTVCLMILIFGKHSGSMINPAVTVAVASSNLLKRNLIIPYLLFQILAAVLAGITLRLLFGSAGANTEMGATKLTSGISPELGIAIEALGTFILASSALFASTRISKQSYQALWVGTTLFILILFIGPLTGAGFNPARSIGPSIASGYTENLYVYVVGPVIGAVAAGLVFRLVRKNGKQGNSFCLC